MRASVKNLGSMAPPRTCRKDFFDFSAGAFLFFKKGRLQSASSLLLSRNYESKQTNVDSILVNSHVVSLGTVLYQARSRYEYYLSLEMACSFRAIHM